MSKKFRICSGLILIAISTILVLKFYRQFERTDLTVVGFIKRHDGLGRQSIELIETLKSEFKINFISTRSESKKEISPEFRKKHMTKSPKWGKVVIFEDMLWDPGNDLYFKVTKCDPSSIKFAYSMWESTRIPYEWVMILNQHFDAVLVPSKFLIDVYKKSGVKIPVFQLPLGLDLKSFFKRPLKEKCGYPMVFGNLSACSDRKNQIALVKAFAQAFGDNPDVLLRINCRSGEKEIKEAVTREISDLNYDNIIFTQFSLAKDPYLETFREIDCYVSASKGEGFSIQPREAMALGIPVIASNNTGQQEICESGLVKVVDSPIVESALYPWDVCYGRNFNCTIDDLADAMIEVKDNYDYYLSNGIKSRKWANQYQYKNLKPLYCSIISPKSVILGEKNEITEDCVITDSPELYEKYKQAFNF